MLSKLKALWNKLPEGVKRVLHTAWQAAFGVLVQALLAAHSSGDVKAAVWLSGTTFAAVAKAAFLRLVVARG